MYFLITTALMLVLPALSIILDLCLGRHATPVMAVIGKWYVFWAAGVRLLLAGFRQMTKPQYTAETILGIKAPEAHVVVRELGFANFSLGVLGCISLFVGGWAIPAALASGIFYGLAGINHALRGHRNKHENMAMITDLLASAVLLIFCVWGLMR